MHDIAISGGTIRDGTGAPGFTGDVAIGGVRVVAAGWRGQDAGARPAPFVRAD